MPREYKVCPYGAKLKMKLLELNRSQKWLEEEITKRTGLYCDSGTLGVIIRGESKREKLVNAINEILGITYE